MAYIHYLCNLFEFLCRNIPNTPMPALRITTSMNDFEITREKIIIRTRPLKNGNSSIYLEMHHEGKRTTECLHLYLIPELTDEDKKQNELTMLAVQNIRAQRYKEAAKKGFSHEILERESVDTKLVDYIAKDRDRRQNIGMAYSRTHNTLIYWINKIAPSILLKDVNRIFALKLRDALANTPSEYTGELLKSKTISGVFWLFGHIMQKATDEGKANFRQELLPSLKGLGQPSGIRQSLTFDELQRLIKTPCKDENTRSSFLFSCATGLRWSDLTKLKWKNIVMHDDKWQLETLQSKTRKYVYVPLNRLAQSVLPQRKADEDPVFELGANTNRINIRLQEWVEEAGIDKHISFYCSRHTFATLQYEFGASLFTTQRNLGHCDIESTMGYTHILEGKKIEVTDKINKMFEDRMKKRIVWERKQKK